MLKSIKFLIFICLGFLDFECCKTYMYNVWNTIHPKNVQTVLEYANNVRFSVDNDIVKKNTILITEEW